MRPLIVFVRPLRPETAFAARYFLAIGLLSVSVSVSAVIQFQELFDRPLTNSVSIEDLIGKVCFDTARSAGNR